MKGLYISFRIVKKNSYVTLKISADTNETFETLDANNAYNNKLIYGIYKIRSRILLKCQVGLLMFTGIQMYRNGRV